MRILLISYYFPPAGGAAVMRWLRFIRYLSLKGHRVTVLCSSGGDYPYTDESLLQKIPEDLPVIRAKAPKMSRFWKLIAHKKEGLPHGSLDTKEMGWLARLMVFIRLNFILPDLRVFWNASAYRAALKELKSKPYDAVISTGPPHSSHLIGLKLKKKHPRLKWFTDFRDPWADIHYLQLKPPLPFIRYLHRSMEKRVLQKADNNFIISHAIAAALPEAPKTVIYNGFDPDDFASIEYQESLTLRIKYIGQITAGQDALQILHLCKYIPQKLELSFIGTRLSESEIQAFKAELGSSFRHLPFMPHQEALNEAVNSDCLILLINEYSGSKGMLTTKLFEYLASRTPILLIGDTASEAAEVIRECAAGSCFAAHELKQAAEWMAELPSGYRTSGNIGAYSVAKQIDKLVWTMESKNSY